MERMIVQHLHTDKSGRKPLPEDIMYGELAINYVANGETLFIKNSEGAIAEFKDDKYYQKQLSEKTDKTLSLTYSELVSLRDNSQLIPGQQYRITDYTCTTTQEGTQSAGHQFDIIVKADSENKLNEEANAIQHTKDDIDYFANSDLSAWKLWYCLDNDTTRFAWADTTNGKGVIYRMIDEFNNDVPYDFKNIQFYRKWDADKSLWSTISSDNTGVPCYTFSSSGNSATTLFTDMSLLASNSIYSNVIGKYVNNKQTLNNICFFGNNCYSNTFGNDCYSNTFGGNCGSNTFGNDCGSNTFGNIFQYNTFGNNCGSNTFRNDCNSNTFGNNCGSNTFRNDCSSNTFGNNCGSNTFGYNCYCNTFGNYCYSNTFGNKCSSNTFGNNCWHILFASDSAASTKYDYYQNNHFGDGCKYIRFTGIETASDTQQVQNYNFAQGLQGTITNGVRNRNFETKVEKDSNGNLKIFCLADLIYSGSDDSQPSYPYSTYFIGDI